LLVSLVSLELCKVGGVVLIGMQSQGGHLHFITNSVSKNVRCNLLNFFIIIIFKDINKVPIIHFENIFKIYLKYAKNISLFHCILILYPFTLGAS